MFRDRQQELQRIQQQLLEDDTPEADEELLDDIADAFDEDSYEPDNFYNTDQADLDLDALSDRLQEPQKESLKGLIVAAVLLTLGIGLVLGWWVVRLLA